MAYVGRRITGMTNGAAVAGRATYINDIVLPNQAWMAVVRSPHPHALIKRIDATQARNRPGVLAVFTGEELHAHTNAIPHGADDSAMGARTVAWHTLPNDRVRFLGEAVAAIVAEDRFSAYAARDDIEVEYEEIPAVVDPADALRPGSPLTEPTWPDNVLLQRTFEYGEPLQRIAASQTVVRGSLRTGRVTGAPIEPRGCIASWDTFARRLTYWDAGQQPHVLRTFLAEILRIPEGSIQVVQPRVGGAFGNKQPTYQEQPLAAFASMTLGRPVKWIEERYESLLVGGHARDDRIEYEAAYEADGRVAALRIAIVADVGAPTSFLGWTQAFVTGYCLPSAYNIDDVRVDLTVVATNKCPWVPYRGFGKDVASFVMDRVMDHVSRKTGIDRAETRRRNYIPADAFPFGRPGGAVIDSGNYEGTLQKVLSMIDYDTFPDRKLAARAAGRFVGIGLGQELTPEGVAIPGSLMNSAYDGATVRVSPSGTVTVLTGVTSPGTGNETAIAQIAADTIGCEISDVRVIQGDTELCPYGLGNYASRSVMIGGSAVYLASQDLRQKLLDVAASMLEVSPNDLDASHGRIYVRGSDHRGVTLREVVDEVYRHTFGRHAHNIEPGLEATRYFRTGNIYHQPETQGRFSTYPTWSNGTAACIVDVDVDTGVVRIVQYCLVSDSGRIINPVLADANLHGSIAQGIGGAMYERLAYDDNGQLLTGSFMDYTIPTAAELPRFELEHQVTPTPFTALGTKGVGESGITGPLAALCGAVEDALSEFDVHIDKVPLTPDVVWRAIKEARRQDAPQLP